MLPDFNRLKIFCLIYATRRVVAAAGKLNITPSAVSQQLKKLEFEIKAPLFTRLHKKLVPTMEADRLFDLVNPFMQDLEAGLGTINQARIRPSGLLRIGAPEEFGKAYFPGVFASFREAYPDVTFTLTLGDPSILLPMVGGGELDFALVDVFLTQSGIHGDLGIFSIEPIIDEEVILACSKEYCEAVLNKDYSYKSLMAGTFITYQQAASELHSWFKHHFRKSAIHPNIVTTVDSIMAVISCIRHHMGMGIITSHLVGEEIRAGEIVPITTGRKEIINRISLVQLQDKIPSLTEKTFQKHFKAAMGKVGELKKYASFVGRSTL